MQRRSNRRTSTASGLGTRSGSRSSTGPGLGLGEQSVLSDGSLYYMPQRDEGWWESLGNDYVMDRTNLQQFDNITIQRRQSVRIIDIPNDDNSDDFSLDSLPDMVSSFVYGKRKSGFFKKPNKLLPQVLSKPNSEQRSLLGESYNRALMPSQSQPSEDNPPSFFPEDRKSNNFSHSRLSINSDGLSDVSVGDMINKNKKQLFQAKRLSKLPSEQHFQNYEENESDNSEIFDDNFQMQQSKSIFPTAKSQRQSDFVEALSQSNDDDKDDTLREDNPSVENEVRRSLRKSQGETSMRMTRKSQSLIEENPVEKSLNESNSTKRKRTSKIATPKTSMLENESDEEMSIFPSQPMDPAERDDDDEEIFEKNQQAPKSIFAVDKDKIQSKKSIFVEALSQNSYHKLTQDDSQTLASQNLDNLEITRPLKTKSLFGNKDNDIEAKKSIFAEALSEYENTMPFSQDEVTTNSQTLVDQNMEMLETTRPLKTKSLFASKINNIQAKKSIFTEALSDYEKTMPLSQDEVTNSQTLTDNFELTRPLKTKSIFQTQATNQAKKSVFADALSDTEMTMTGSQKTNNKLSQGETTKGSQTFVDNFENFETARPIKSIFNVDSEALKAKKSIFAQALSDTETSNISRFVNEDDEDEPMEKSHRQSILKQVEPSETEVSSAKSMKRSMVVSPNSSASKIKKTASITDVTQDKTEASFTMTKPAPPKTLFNIKKPIDPKKSVFMNALSDSEESVVSVENHESSLRKRISQRMSMRKSKVIETENENHFQNKEDWSPSSVASDQSVNFNKWQQLASSTIIAGESSPKTRNKPRLSRLYHSSKKFEIYSDIMEEKESVNVSEQVPKSDGLETMKAPSVEDRNATSSSIVGNMSNVREDMPEPVRNARAVHHIEREIPTDINTTSEEVKRKSLKMKRQSVGSWLRLEDENGEKTQPLNQSDIDRQVLNEMMAKRTNPPVRRSNELGSHSSREDDDDGNETGGSKRFYPLRHSNIPVNLPIDESSEEEDSDEPKKLYPLRHSNIPLHGFNIVDEASPKLSTSKMSLKDTSLPISDGKSRRSSTRLKSFSQVEETEKSIRNESPQKRVSTRLQNNSKVDNSLHENADEPRVTKDVSIVEEKVIETPDMVSEIEDGENQSQNIQTPRRISRRISSSIATDNNEDLAVIDPKEVSLTKDIETRNMVDDINKFENIETSRRVSNRINPDKNVDLPSSTDIQEDQAAVQNIESQNAITEIIDDVNQSQNINNSRRVSKRISSSVTNNKEVSLVNVVEEIDNNVDQSQKNESLRRVSKRISSINDPKEASFVKEKSVAQNIETENVVSDINDDANHSQNIESSRRVSNRINSLIMVDQNDDLAIKDKSATQNITTDEDQLQNSRRLSSRTKSPAPVSNMKSDPKEQTPQVENSEIDSLNIGASFMQNMEASSIRNDETSKSIKTTRTSTRISRLSVITKNSDDLQETTTSSTLKGSDFTESNIGASFQRNMMSSTVNMTESNIGISFQKNMMSSTVNMTERSSVSTPKSILRRQLAVQEQNETLTNKIVEEIVNDELKNVSTTVAGVESPRSRKSVRRSVRFSVSSPAPEKETLVEKVAEPTASADDEDRTLVADAGDSETEEIFSLKLPVENDELVEVNQQDVPENIHTSIKEKSFKNTEIIEQDVAANVNASSQAAESAESIREDVADNIHTSVKEKSMKNTETNPQEMPESTHTSMKNTSIAPLQVAENAESIQEDNNQVEDDSHYDFENSAQLTKGRYSIKYHSNMFLDPNAMSTPKQSKSVRVSLPGKKIAMLNSQLQLSKRMNFTEPSVGSSGDGSTAKMFNLTVNNSEKIFHTPKPRGNRNYNDTPSEHMSTNADHMDNNDYEMSNDYSEDIENQGVSASNIDASEMNENKMLALKNKSKYMEKIDQSELLQYLEKLKTINESRKKASDAIVQKLLTNKSQPVFMNLAKSTGKKPALNFKRLQLPKAKTQVSKNNPKKKLYMREQWITPRLYKFVQNHLEEQYGVKSEKRSERFVKDLANVVNMVAKNKTNYYQYVETLRTEMARLEIVSTYRDFHNFVRNYLPFTFRLKAIPAIGRDVPILRYKEDDLILS